MSDRTKLEISDQARAEASFYLAAVASAYPDLGSTGFRAGPADVAYLTRPENVQEFIAAKTYLSCLEPTAPWPGCGGANAQWSYTLIGQLETLFEVPAYSHRAREFSKAEDGYIEARVTNGMVIAAALCLGLHVYDRYGEPVMISARGRRRPPQAA